LGIELNEDVIKERFLRGKGGYFDKPTDEWNDRNSNDRLWS